MTEDATTTGTTAAPGAPARRTVLRGVALAGGLGLAGGVLGACGAGATTARGGSGAPSPAGAGDEATPPGSAAGGDSATSSPSPGAQALASTTDVPVGGGIILQGAEIVVTQPVAGEYRGFSSICTHQRCPLAEVDGGTINCNCHGSRFSIEDGSVKRGPAEQPLPEVAVQVRDGDIVTA